MEKIIIYHDPVLDEIGAEWLRAVDKYYEQWKTERQARGEHDPARKSKYIRKVTCTIEENYETQEKPR